MYTDSNKFESLSDFYNSIKMGLDIVFKLFGVRYNISWENYKPFICTCPDGEAVVFEDTNDLLDNYLIENRPIKELWKEIEIEHM